MWIALTNVAPGVSAGSVHAYAGRPNRARRASTRARSSNMCTILMTLAPAINVSSVNATLIVAAAESVLANGFDTRTQYFAELARGGVVWPLAVAPPTGRLVTPLAP